MAKKKKVEEVVNSLDDLFAKYSKDIDVELFAETNDKVKLIPTGRPSIDFATDGGLPERGIVIIAGSKSSGKTSFAIQAAGCYNTPILYCDSEYTTDKEYIDTLGVDSTKVLRAKKESMEDMCDFIRGAIPDFRVIIWDSISNMSSNEELQKEAGDRTRANSAIVLSTQMKRIAYLCDKHNTVLIVISHVSQNQERNTKYDPKYYIAGGERLHHNSSLTIMLNPSSKDKSKDKDSLSGFETVKGRDVRFVVEKNKNGIPFRVVKCRFVYGEGYSVVDDVFNTAKNLNIINRSGAYYSYDGNQIGQGELRAKQMLSDNPELLEQIRDKVYSTYINNKEEHTLDDIIDLDTTEE